MERKCSSCIRVERVQSHVLGKVFYYLMQENGKCLVAVYLFGRLKCVGHSFAYVAYFVFLRDVWIELRELS
jgi:hypothetical protein